MPFIDESMIDKSNKSILSVILEHRHVSLLFKQIFPTRYRFICSFELVLPFQNNASYVHILSFNFLYKFIRHNKISAPDFVIMPIKVQVKDIKNLHLTLSCFTKATVINLLIPSGKVYFAGFSYTGYQNRLTIVAYNVQLNKNLKSLRKLKLIIKKHTLQRSNLIVTKNCMFSNFRSTALTLKIDKSFSWAKCQKEMIMEMLNFTLDKFRVCGEIFHSSIKTKDLIQAKSYYFYSSHGDSRYSYFYTSNPNRNIYARLSPFSFEG